METSQTNRLNLLTGESVDNTTPDTTLDIAADTDSSGGGCCGGGSCACSSSAAPAFDLSGSRGLVTDSADSAASHDSAHDSTAPARRSGIAGIASQATEFLVTGMTCGHCVSSVRDEVSAVAGVYAVEVVLKKGGSSRVTIMSSGSVDAGAVRAAVEEAGYQLV
jgi:copper chaperone